MRHKKLRKITINGDNYLWNRKHVHFEDYEYSPCVEILTIYQEGKKKCPLRIYFRTEDDIKSQNSPKDSHWEVGYPEDGVIWQTGNDTGYVNLNRPGVVAEIIKFAVPNYWETNKANKPTEIQNGFEWVEVIDFPRPARVNTEA